MKQYLVLNVLFYLKTYFPDVLHVTALLFKNKYIPSKAKEEHKELVLFELQLVTRRQRQRFRLEIKKKPILFYQVKRL